MPEKDHGTEARILQEIITGLGPLDNDVKLRLLDTVARLFDLAPAGRHGTRYTINSPQVIETQGAISAELSEDAVSPKSFLIDKAPQTLVERVACLAFYLTHFRDRPHFKTLDISQLNTEAAQTKFSNTAQSVADTTRARLLATAGKGNKQISAMGEEYVKALPDRQAAAAVLKRLKPGNKRKKKKVAKKRSLK